jgi:hypothetical protein
MQQANHYIEETDELVAHYVFSFNTDPPLAGRVGVFISKCGLRASQPLNVGVLSFSFIT